MIFINLQNIEELLLIDPKIRSIFSDLTHIIDQWLLSQRLPALRSLKQQSKIDLLNNISNKHIEKLEEYFDDTISIDTINNNIVKNYKFCTDVFYLDRELTAVEGFGNFAVARNADNIYISFWR